MKRIWIAAGIILLLVGTSTVPISAHAIENVPPASRESWLYVGGSGPGNYTTIKDAVKNASAGDTIFVYHGVYREAAIQISNINLIGEDRNTTIINASGIFTECISVNGKVNIHGFTIQNSNGGVGIFTGGVDDIKISNNIITKCAQGIYVMGLPQIEIYDNVFSDNTDIAIIIMFGRSNSYSIHDNFFLSNHIGIQTEGGRSVSIEHNHFEGNEIGVSIMGSRASITRNNFINNDEQAEFQRICSLQSIFIMPMFYKPSFSENYWDDWVRTSPRPIGGAFFFYMLRILVLLDILPGDYVWYFSLPILMQFDWHPAQEPYDIIT